MAFSLPTDDPEAPPQDKGDVDKKALETFTQGAQDHSTAMEAPAPQAPPWDQYDSKDKTTKNVSVRLNRYHLSMLRFIAEADETTQQKILKNILVPELERLAREAWDQQ